MEFRKILTLRGPNVWARFPVLEAWVDLGALKDSPSDELPGLNERLMAWLPNMIEHRCSIGERGGFFERLRRGTYQAHILEHVTLELQTLAGTDLGFGRARETSEEGVYKVAIRYEDEGFAKACLHAARDLCMAAVHDRPYDVAAEVARLTALNLEERLGPSTHAIVSAARERGIPYKRLNTGSLVQLGHGDRQRRILAAETDRTGAIAESIAQDKELTRTLLQAVGVPVPEGRPVTDAEDAWAAAQELGLPVVVKPRGGNHGRGVATNLNTREQVVAAYSAAAKEGESCLVETFAPGADFRLLVVGGRMVAAARRDPAQVVGDGVSTIEQLVAVANRDPRRSDGHATSLSFIPLDEVSLAALASQGFGPASVPARGETVLVRLNANLSTGGTATDVTNVVHHEVSARAIEAARVVGLDIAGVDVVARDITRPLETQGGVIVEVNAGPGLRMHLQPSSGEPRAVGRAIIDMMFPAGENGRVPIVAITGVNGKTTTTRLIGHIARETGKTVGMTCTDGVYVGDRRLETGDCSGPSSAGKILLNPWVEFAALETARGGILRAGLGFDRCDVAVVTNIGEGDHLGLADVHTLEKLAEVKSTIVEAVATTGTAVLNAADPLVAAMASQCRGSVLFFTVDPDHAVLADHRAKGGRAAFVRHGEIVLAEGEREIGLARLTDVPLTHGGRIGFQVENVLAAAGAAWAVGVDLDLIRAGLYSFGSEMESSPGRFNLLEINGSTVILDYGHNPSALLALVDAIEQFPHERRSIVYSAAGDRRDCDLIRQGEILGDTFDRVIVYEDHYLRGRAQGEITNLFRKGLAAGVRVSDVHAVVGAVKSVEKALKLARPGELLVIQADVIDETLDFIRRYLAGVAEGREIDLSEALEVSSEAGALVAAPEFD